ncbi:GAF domain-containing sensor histidine kinase [Nocardia panacis]|uniref:GAF domain-containing sensor histidine kinase n=1 Tax=Nocardia panacis TaxID=2340916 RepID=A0A3A4K4R2_9NOCA|nr:GAF domain-containing sensor histidine kinase [Nocardia panacis]RJO69254.1 GAF domain-containing sensor histidine kinase [Nocardia panacis]
MTRDQGAQPAARDTLSPLRLRELLTEVQDRVETILDSRCESARACQAWLAATRTLTARLLVDPDLDRALGYVVDRIRTLTGSAQTFLAAAESEDDALIITHWSGPEDEYLGRTIDLANTLPGAAFSARSPARTDDCTNLGVPLENMGHALILPLGCPESVLGVAVAVRPAEELPYSEELVELAVGFTEQAALTLCLAGARPATPDLVADRDRIARDLHDHVIQRLFGIGLSLQGALPKAMVPEVRQRLSTAITDLQEVVQDIRGSIFDLHGGHDGERGLQQRLEYAIRQQTADTALRATIQVTGPLSVLDRQLADHAEAVVREAISNAVKHSGADTVSVEIGVDDDLTIVVTDNGWGIPNHVIRSGLRNLEQRAEKADGTFTLGPGSRDPEGVAGTRLCWSVPLPTGAS